MMMQAPFGHDGAAARDDAGHAFGGEGHVGEAHTGVNGEIIDALFGLLDERIAEDFPSQLDGSPSHFSSA